MPRGLYIRTEAIKEKSRGVNNGRWKGESVGYMGIHIWLPKHYGKAKNCQANLVGLVCSNKSKKFEWAKLKDKPYERKRENFIQLCITCHRNYDNSNPPKGWNKGLIGFNKGHPPTNTKPNKTSFKKGSIPWNKGLTRKKIYG